MGIDTHTLNSDTEIEVDENDANDKENWIPDELWELLNSEDIHSEDQIFQGFH